MNHYNELAMRIHENAVKHGFWDKKCRVEHYLMFVIAEIWEMQEAYMRNKRANIKSFSVDIKNGNSFEQVFRKRIKDTLEDKMADVIICLLNLAWEYKVEIDYKCVRCFDEFSFIENVYRLYAVLMSSAEIQDKINPAIGFVREWAVKYMNIDLDWHIEQKMRYNESRPFRKKRTKNNYTLAERIRASIAVYSIVDKTTSVPEIVRWQRDIVGNSYNDTFRKVAYALEEEVEKAKRMSSRLEL